MCGRMNVIDSPEVQWLCEMLGITLYPVKSRRDIAPGGPLQIVHQVAAERRVSDAIWWLLLDPKTLKPNYKYASFNSKSSKLHEKRAIAYKPYRESRCIILASAFVEGLGDKKTYHKIELEGSAIAFGGLYREYVDKETGETVYGASVITLGPLLPEWQDIHPKSMPLILPSDSELMDKWLDPEFKNIEEFESLLEPRVTHNQIVTPINKPSRWEPIADSFLIKAVA